jgi:hypothetical protein
MALIGGRSRRICQTCYPYARRSCSETTQVCTGCLRLHRLQPVQTVSKLRARRFPTRSVGVKSAGGQAAPLRAVPVVPRTTSSTRNSCWRSFSEPLPSPDTALIMAWAARTPCS